MRNILTGLLITCAAAFGTAQGIEFFHGTWDEALEEAGKQNKLIFVDAYATWCGPCKRMAAQVFPLKEVGEFYNAHFINMKLDMERGEGLKFRKKYPVSAFPTFFWIDHNGEVVFTTKGAKRPDDFIALGKKAAGKYDGSAQFQALYEQGDRNYETIYNYVVELNKSGKSSLRVANDYLNEQEDLTTPKNLRFIAAAAVQVDSRIFEFFEAHLDEITKLEGQEKVHEIIRSASQTTVERGIKYESRMLIDEAVATMEEYLPKEADAFAVIARLDYAVAWRDAEDYADHARTYLKKFADDRPGYLTTMSSDIIKTFGNRPRIVELGVEAAEKAVDLEPSEDHVMAYAVLLYMNKDKETALEVLDEAIKAAGRDKRKVKDLESLKRRFEST